MGKYMMLCIVNSFIYRPMHIYEHLHCMHAYMYAYTHTYMYTYMYADINTMYMCIHTYIGPTYMFIPTAIFDQGRLKTGPSSRTFLYIHVHVYKIIYIHTYMY